MKDASMKELAPRLYDAAIKAMECLTGENEKEWRKSQAYPEAPYHFLYLAITGAEM